MKKLVIVRNGKITISEQFITEWVAFQKEAKEMEEKTKEIKEALKNAMEKYNVSKYENEFIKVTYKSASTRITVDSKRLKEDLPGIYEEYSKIVNVSSYVNIDIK